MFRRPTASITVLAVLTIILINLNGCTPTRNTEQKTPISQDNQLPAHWKISYIKEPVFNANILKVETGQRHNTSIVLIHGLGKNGYRDWKHVIPALENHYHVIAVDLPGFGLSDKPEGQYSPTNYAKLIDHLAQRYAKKKKIIIGHSMGAAIALRYAAHYPDNIHRLVLVDSAGILERAAYTKAASRINSDASVLPGFSQRWLLRMKNFAGGLVEIASMNRQASNTFEKTDAPWVKNLRDKPSINAGMALINSNFSDDLERLKVPTNIIWGEKDKVVPMRTARLLRGKIKLSDLHIVEGANHTPMTSRPFSFNRQLLAVLEKPVPLSETLPKVVKNKKDLHCHNETGKYYTGHYRHISLTNCLDIRLHQLTAESLSIDHSIVEITNSVIEGQHTALTATQAHAVMTNVKLVGETGIKSLSSRLDLAGVSIQAKHSIANVTRSSRFIFSVSDGESQQYSGNLHGPYKIAHQLLEDSLSANDK